MNLPAKVFLISISFMLALTSCTGGGREPESIVARMVEPMMNLDWPVYFWETTDGETSVYRIVSSTDDIHTLLWGLEGVRALDCSMNAVYILRDDTEGHLMLTRLEKDSRRTTDAKLPVDLVADRNRPWAVSPNDIVAVSGIDADGKSRIILSTWTRTEPEETFRRDDLPEAEIDHSETEWYSGEQTVEDMALSNDGDVLAAKLRQDEDADAWLYLIDEPGGDPVRIGEYPVGDLGGFSPDDSMFAATFSLEEREDVFVFDTSSLELEPVTRVPMGFETSNPTWHPRSQYLFYNTDYTTEFVAGTTPLSGEQLFIYHVPTANVRRLTAFEGTDIWIDFAPNGDVFIYSSVEGVIGGRGRALPSRDPEAGEQSDLETWRIFYIPWDVEDFLTSEDTILRPQDLQFFISWTVGGEGEIGFAWGPELDSI